MRTALALLILIPALAVAHDKPKPQPEPAPVQEPKGCSCWWQPVAVIGGAVGLAFYLDEKRKQKVAVQPTDDGKGAKVAYERRF
jgi:hypothetical protein